MASKILSAVTSIFSPPKPEKPTVAPAADDEELAKARRRTQQAAARRGGRASTIMSDGLGG